MDFSLLRVRWSAHVPRWGEGIVRVWHDGDVIGGRRESEGGDGENEADDEIN